MLLEQSPISDDFRYYVPQIISRNRHASANFDPKFEPFKPKRDHSKHEVARWNRKQLSLQERPSITKILILKNLIKLPGR